MWYKRIQEDYEDEMEEFDKLPRNPNYRPKDNHERETQEEANERERRRLVEQRRGRYGGGQGVYFAGGVVPPGAPRRGGTFPSNHKLKTKGSLYWGKV